MFGYINVNRDELNKEQIFKYQSYYCGLCKQLKDSFGIKGQLLLNYDMTFLIMLWSGLYDLDLKERAFLCKLHPTKKKIGFINQATSVAADMDIILSYHSLMDSYEDDNSLIKLRMAKALEKPYDKVHKKYPDKVEAVEELIRQTNNAQLRKEKNLELVAGYTGQMMSKLFAWIDDDYKQRLSDMGFYLGKFIYMMDCYEDLHKDMKNNNYNPLKYMKFDNYDAYETYCKSTLGSFMTECVKSYEELGMHYNKDILDNILYSGVWTKYDRIRYLENNGRPRVKKKRRIEKSRRFDKL